VQNNVLHVEAPEIAAEFAALKLSMNLCPEQNDGNAGSMAVRKREAANRRWGQIVAQIFNLRYDRGLRPGALSAIQTAFEIPGLKRCSISGASCQ